MRLVRSSKGGLFYLSHAPIMPLRRIALSTPHSENEPAFVSEELCILPQLEVS
jgi:hypothetical protein